MNSPITILRLCILLCALCIGTLTAAAIELTEHLPAQPSETAIIVCPGGSYFWLDYQTEGDSVARSLAQNGIAAYVLRYRTGGIVPFITHSRLLIPGHHHPMPLNDVQCAQSGQVQEGRGNGILCRRTLGTLCCHLRKW